MSDLQDLIATNAVRAYNEGFERGATEERDRIITLIREAQRAAMSKNGGYSKEVAEAFGQEWPLVTGWKDQLIALIKGEPK